MAETEIDCIEDDDKKLKKQEHIDRHGPRPIPNVSQISDLSYFSLYRTLPLTIWTTQEGNSFCSNQRCGSASGSVCF